MKRKIRWRKRALGKTSPRSEFSKALREVNESLRANNHIGGLEILNRLAVTHRSPAQLGKILLLTADSECRLGRYDQSARIYSRSLEHFRTTSDPDFCWFKAAYGEIDALLKALRTEEAYSKAGLAVKMAKDDQKMFSKSENLSVEELLKEGGITVGPRPRRPAAISTSIGLLFLNAGYPDTAVEFLQDAIQNSPNGASRARQGMARIALSKGELEDAERLARESLQMGRFQAKTLYSWDLYHEARSRRGKAIFDPFLYESMMKTSTQSVAQRALLLVVGSLRKWSDPEWKRLAEERVVGNQPGFDPILRVELAKMLLAEAKITDPDPAVVAAAAGSLLNEQIISRSEAVSLTKTYAIFSLRSGSKEGEVYRTIGKLQHRFGSRTKARALHAASLGAMLAGRHDIARKWLQSQISESRERSTQWRMDVWALARLESVSGNYEIAATHYLTVAEHQETPPRFQIQGLLCWLQQVQLSGIQPDFDATVSKLKVILSRMDDFRFMLDAARQLALAGEPFFPMMEVVAESAVASARHALERAATASEALAILIQLSRRQHHDLFRTHEIHEYWDSLPQLKREWLWSEAAIYWEYQSLLILSYEESGKPEAADATAISLIEAETTPSHGMAHIASSYGGVWIRRGDLGKAISLFEKMVSVAPSHRLAAEGYYWMALLAKKRRDNAGTVRNAMLIRRCFAPKAALFREWELDGRAILLIESAEPTKRSESDRLQYSADYMNRQNDGIAEDLSMFP